MSVTFLFFVSRTHTCHASKMHDGSGNSDCLVCISWLLLTGRCDCCLTEALCQPCRVLQQTETDPRRLCSLSGAWFTEECNKRHQIWSGSALIHATIRHRKTKSRGPFSVNTLLLLQACGAVFPTAIGIPYWCGYVVCCYSNRCTPDWTVQWRERENLPQQQHLSWGWEKTEGHKGQGERRVSAVCHRKNNFTVCSCNLPKSLMFVLFSGVKGV